MCAEPIATLATAHSVELPFTIELRAALTESEHVTAAERKGHGACS